MGRVWAAAVWRPGAWQHFRVLMYDGACIMDRAQDVKQLACWCIASLPIEEKLWARSTDFLRWGCKFMSRTETEGLKYLWCEVAAL